jgi:hypothetical protein
VDWIYLAQNSDQWRFRVNTVMNLRVPPSPGNLLTNGRTITFSGTLSL